MSCNSCGSSGICAFGSNWWWIIILIIVVVIWGGGLGGSCYENNGCGNCCENSCC